MLLKQFILSSVRTNPRYFFLHTTRIMDTAILVRSKVVNVPDMVIVDFQHLNIILSSTHSQQTMILRFIYKLRFDSVG